MPDSDNGDKITRRSIDSFAPKRRKRRATPEPLPAGRHNDVTGVTAKDALQSNADGEPTGAVALLNPTKKGKKGLSKCIYFSEPGVIDELETLQSGRASVSLILTQMAKLLLTNARQQDVQANRFVDITGRIYL